LVLASPALPVGAVGRTVHGPYRFITPRGRNTATRGTRASIDVVASIGHVIVGAWTARVAPLSEARWRDTLLLGSLALLPDLDVIAFAVRVPYAAPFGHRGASHSLLAALLVGFGASLVARRLGTSATRVGLVATLVVASHGLLDALTDGGLGAALLWPFSDERVFAPWRPLPVAPIGARFWTGRGLAVVAAELCWFAPLAVWTLWPRRRSAPSLPSCPS
jgi:inner membrane protein